MTENKLLTMQEAVNLLPKTGCRLALGGVTMYRRPMAFATALVYEYSHAGVPRELSLLCFTAGLESDMLVGAGMVSRVRTCYFGLEVFGLAPHFTRRAAKAEIEIIEETEASLAFGLRASLAGVGFMPSTAWLGTDLPKLRPEVRTVKDPYSGEELIAFPAIDCDLAVIHALKADAQGNADIGSNWGIDRELALVAEKVIITAEEVVDRLDKADIIGTLVKGVVEAPNGAWPTSCHPLYPLDGMAVLAYIEAAGTVAYSALIASWNQAQGIDFLD